MANKEERSTPFYIREISANIILACFLAHFVYRFALDFIKTMRASDADAAMYYLARMIEGGEDIKFIGRRIMISASEDVGLANPNALLMATTTAKNIR